MACEIRGLSGGWPKGRAAAMTIMAVGLSCLVGCGAGMSAGDMRQYAIQRPSDDEESPPPAKVNPNDSNSSAKKTAAPVPDASPAPVAWPEAATAKSNDTADATVAGVSERAADTPATLAGATLSDTASPPATPMDPEARARRTVENLTRIGQAFEAYAADKGLYPTRAIFAAGNETPLLSWRVALLPYLGYQELYAQFRLDEPWNSRHNSELLSQIPAVFQSPERFDERTNYLVPVASSSIFGGRRGVAPRNIEDGARNTVIALEVNDELAVPWTEPREYDLDLRAPTKSLGALRNNSMYVVWGGGEVGRVSITAPQESLRAMYTDDAGENFVAGSIDRPLFTEIVPSGEVTVPQPLVAAVGATSSPAANGNGVAAMANSGDAALAALAAEYLKRSTEELSRGNERDSALLFYASAVVGPAGGEWTQRYQWVPALRRPTPLVRFGVGLDYSGPREKAIRQAGLTGAQRSSIRATQGDRAWSMVTGGLGEQIVKVLSSHVEKSGGEPLTGELPSKPVARPRRTQPGSILESSHGAPLAPGVYFLAAARESVLLAAARREGVDVLVVVDWRDAGHKWSAGLKLVDVVRGEALLTLPRVTSAALEESRTNPLADNPFSETFRQLTEYLEENLAMQPLPEQIKRRHVARRLDALAASSDENPLRNLAEMRYFGERGLADQTQVLLAYQALIGTKAGSELMLGDAAAKQRLLKPWLPLPAPPK